MGFDTGRADTSDMNSGNNIRRPTPLKNRDLSIWHVYYSKLQKTVTDANNFHVYSDAAYHNMKRRGELINEVAEMVTAAHSGSRSLP